MDKHGPGKHVPVFDSARSSPVCWRCAGDRETRGKRCDGDKGTEENRCVGLIKGASAFPAEALVGPVRVE